MRNLILILLMLPLFCVAQYPIVEEFDSFGGAGEWTVDNGGGVQNYGGAENYATFNIGVTPYLNNTTHTILSQTYDFSDCSSDITISFPMSGLVETGNDVMNFEYYDGGAWVTDLTVTGLVTGTYTNTAIPNTTTQFRFQLITNGPDQVYFRTNLTQYSYTFGGVYTVPVDLSTQFIGGAPKTIQTYYYDITRFTIDCATVLPIELLIFDCEVNDGKTELYWSTASQINNDFFSVEHSTDGYNWKIINIIDGAGNSSQIQEYLIHHTDVPNGTNYYRLTQFDYDGNSQTFNVVSCTSGGKEKEINFTKYYNNIGQEISKPLYGYYLEIIWYKDETQRVNKRFIIKQ